jgi:hypothetical protein
MLRDRVPRQPFAAPLINQMAPAGMCVAPLWSGVAQRISVNPTIEPATPFWCFRSETGCAFADLITDIEDKVRRARQDVPRAHLL